MIIASVENGNVASSEAPDIGAHSEVSSSRQKSTFWFELSILLFLGFVARLLWIFMVPPSDAPDEPCHIWVAQFLSEHARLPHVKDVLDGGFAAVYGPMPQMGYLAQALTGKLLAFLGAPYQFRFGSLLMGVTSIAFAYLIGKELFSRDRIARLALPILMIFHPQLVFVQTYTNNDATVSALGTAITFIAIRFINRGVTPAWSAVLGLLLGWTALSKFSAYALFVGAAVAFIGATIVHGTSAMVILQSMVAALALCGASCGWWFIRQLHEYPGDLLGTQTAHGIWLESRHVPPLKIGFWQVAQTPIYWEIMSKSYLGVFGYMKRYMWSPLYLIYGDFAVLATAGSGAELIRTLVKSASASPGEPIQKKKSALLILTLFACIIPTLAAITYAACNNFPVQGRYLMGVEAPILLLVILGLKGFGTRFGNVALIGLMTFNLLVYIAAFSMLYPVYGFHFVSPH